MFSQPDRARFLPLAELHVLVAQLMQLGYQCLGPAVENGAIVMRELDDPAGLPRGLQAEQAPGRYRLTRDPHNRYFAWANGPQAIKPQAFAAKESLWRVERDDGGGLQFAAVLPAAPAQAIIGVRACDLAALALQDAHVLPAGRHDAHYAARREQLFLVAVQCAEPGAVRLGKHGLWMPWFFYQCMHKALACNRLVSLSACRCRETGKAILFDSL